MQYLIDYLLDKGVVKVKMNGRLNFQTAEQYSKEAIKLARENSCTKFLIDHTDTKLEEGIYKIHTAGEELQQFGFKDTDRIAIIISDSDNYSKLFETVNQNNRWSTFKYFNENNIEEAIQWLSETDMKK